jgi:O-antigen ligase
MAGLAIGAMAISKSKAEWLWAWVMAALAMGIALWTGSRGAALAIVGALVVGVIVVPAMRSVRALAGSVSAMAGGLAVVWLAPVAPSYLMGLTRAVQQTASGDVTTGRTVIWRNVIGAIRDRPWFGYGEGQMHTVAPFWDMVQPHDFILQVALAWGLVGLLCVLIMAIAFARRAIPAVRNDQDALTPVFVAMAAIAILSLYDGALFYTLPISIFLACAAVIASQWNSAGADRQICGAPQQAAT